MVKNKKTHILVIRLSAMGDVAMTVPLVVGLIKKYPLLRITVLTKPFFAPVFEGIPNVSVHLADVKGKHKGLNGLWKLYKELKGLQLEGVADLHHVLRSTVLKQFFKFTNITFVQLDKGRVEKKMLTNPKRFVFKQLKSTHSRYAEVCNKLGYPIAENEMTTLPKRLLTKQVAGYIKEGDKTVLGIAPFAAFAGKAYPLSLMAEVVQRLDKTDRYKIILFGGGQNEIEVLAAWEKQFKNAYNVAGSCSFSDELALISHLELMLAMDSGNAHLAAMYGVPTLTLWGVTHPYAGFYPFGQPKENALLADRGRYPLIPTSVYGNKFPSGYEDVMTTITPGEVVKKITAILYPSL